MTTDAHGRAHKPAGSPASTGGQFAAQAAPTAAATLTAPHPLLDRDLSGTIDHQQVAYITAIGHGDEADAFGSLASSEAGYMALDVDRSEDIPTRYGVDGIWETDISGQFSEAQGDEDAWVRAHGGALTDMLEPADIRVDVDEDAETIQLRTGTWFDGTPTFSAADAALMASDEHDILRRFVSERGGLDERLARFEATGQSTLDAEQWNTFVDQYIQSALFSTQNNRANPDNEDEYDPEAAENLDGDYNVSDLSAEDRQKLADQAASFLAHNVHDIERVLDERPGEYDHTNVAHDLWLTRNGHGAGFWDRGFGDLGRRLTDAAKAEGEESLWADSDGALHLGY